MMKRKSETLPQPSGWAFFISVLHFELMNVIFDVKIYHNITNVYFFMTNRIK